jgi:hypothetical protein
MCTYGLAYEINSATILLFIFFVHAGDYKIVVIDYPNSKCAKFSYGTNVPNEFQNK